MLGDNGRQMSRPTPGQCEYRSLSMQSPSPTAPVRFFVRMQPPGGARYTSLSDTLAQTALETASLPGSRLKRARREYIFVTDYQTGIYPATCFFFS
ncbi:hypothetical protein EVAR_33387_1 [Eumeta japonica]|uniref:Uncharacterized protein n=1 Tax=Eumeta variegata TaxID=151549 RepID=A0A4C1X465_EUMVA|nr:hypothetical protein EVAR_33387_1 [Eumeta japonica]